MGRVSTIKRLPAEVRETIGRLRDRGRTIDEILAKLNELDVAISRSALGRHVKQLDAIAGEIRRSRTIAEAIVARYGEEPENRQARLNIELMHALIQRLVIAEEGEPIMLDPQQAMFLSRSLRDLSTAAKFDLDREMKIRRETAKKAADTAEKAVQEAGRTHGFKLPREALTAIREQIYGIVT